MSAKELLAQAENLLVELGWLGGEGNACDIESESVKRSLEALGQTLANLHQLLGPEVSLASLETALANERACQGSARDLARRMLLGYLCNLRREQERDARRARIEAARRLHQKVQRAKLAIATLEQILHRISWPRPQRTIGRFYSALSPLPYDSLLSELEQSLSEIDGFLPAENAGSEKSSAGVREIIKKLISRLPNDASAQGSGIFPPQFNSFSQYRILLDSLVEPIIFTHSSLEHHLEPIIFAHSFLGRDDARIISYSPCFDGVISLCTLDCCVSCSYLSAVFNDDFLIVGRNDRYPTIITLDDCHHRPREDVLGSARAARCLTISVPLLAGRSGIKGSCCFRRRG